MKSSRHDARSIFNAALMAVNPVTLIQRHLQANRDLASAIKNARQVVVIGGGKAGAAMAAGVEAALADQLDRVSGFVNVPEAPIQEDGRIKLACVRSAGCNEPTEAAVAKTREMLALVGNLTTECIVLCLLSGGGSALISAPAHGISLAETTAIAHFLGGRGASIAELNCVRKHLSRVKGGQLAAAHRAGSFWSLIISDVEGDRLDVIASGPTAPDPTTFADALEICNRYHLDSKDWLRVFNHLERGVAGEISDTPKQLPANVHNAIIANNEIALAGAHAEAERRGYRVVRLPPAYSDAVDAATELIAASRQAISNCSAPTCILRGGETTVHLPVHHGLGGRNLQIALQVGMSLPAARATVLCASTDGEDGPTDAAGAIYDAEVSKNADAKQIDAVGYLDRHNSYKFFEKSGGLLKTGLTGTNVMDIHIVLIWPDSRV